VVVCGSVFVVGAWGLVVFWILRGFMGVGSCLFWLLGGCVFGFLLVYFVVFNRVEWWWVNLKRVLFDLVSKCETVQEGVYTHFEQYKS
jgi:hypothetical protein